MFIEFLCVFISCGLWYFDIGDHYVYGIVVPSRFRSTTELTSSKGIELLTCQ